MKKYSKKIMLCAFASLALAVVIIVFIFAFANRTEYYECTNYEIALLGVDADGKQIEVDKANHLKNFEYYRIYLNEKGSTFKLVVKEKDEDEKAYTGFYSKDGDYLVLDYKDGYADEQFKIYYKISKNTLTRVDTEEKTSPDYSASRQIIYQEFKKKVSW